MPAKSAAQRRLMAAALHGATFPKAQQIRRSMSRADLTHFAKKSSTGESYAYNWRSRQNLKQNRDR